MKMLKQAQRNLLLATVGGLFAGTAFAQAVDVPPQKLGFGFAPGLQAGTHYVEGQLIVVLNSAAPRTQTIRSVQAFGGTLKKSLEDNSAVLLDFGNERSALAATKLIGALSGVAKIERNGIKRIPEPAEGLSSPFGAVRKVMVPTTSGVMPRVTPSGTSIAPLTVSSDPASGEQWHLTAIRKTSPEIANLTGTPPTVAVIDTGVDYTHPDLAEAGKVILGKNTVEGTMDPFDDHGHGTHVAGIVAASANNNTYGEGVCPSCKILAVKVLDAQGGGTDFDVAEGMAWTIAHRNDFNPPVKVVNMSLGGTDSALISAQVSAMKQAGLLLVAAAGNSNTTDKTEAYPGANPNALLRVMATDENDCRAWFSNHSPKSAPGQFNIAAPGWNIYSTIPDYGFSPMSGTSMASPIVAGASAVLWGEKPSLSPVEIANLLVSTGKSTTCGFPVSTPRLDIRKAITGTTENTLIGRLLDPALGKAPSSLPSPSVANLFVSPYDGSAALGYAPANRSGFFEISDIGTGARLLKGSRPGFVDGKLRIFTATTDKINGPFTDALPKARPTGTATITLDWKNSQPIVSTKDCTGTCNGWELDLSMALPDGTIIDPFNGGNFKASPYAWRPRDSFDDYQPVETLLIGNQAMDGIYKVYVGNPWVGANFWNGRWTNSLASVAIYNGATQIGTFYSGPPGTCGTNLVWYVGDLVKKGTLYTWANKNVCQNNIP